MQSLVDQYNAAVQTILTDPLVARDRTHPAVQAYLALFAPDSSFAQAALDNWVKIGEEGQIHEPGPAGQMYRSFVDSVEMPSPDAANFVMCTLLSIRTLDRDTGEVLSSEAGVQAATVVAVLVDGGWLLRDLTRASGDLCPAPGDFP